MLSSVFHPQFKLSWAMDSEKIKVITERIVEPVNDKERVHADGNTHESLKKKNSRAAIFSLLCIGNEGFIFQQGLSTTFFKIQYSPFILCLY